MPNAANNAYALTTLCPIKEKTAEGECAIHATREVLQNNLSTNQTNDDSPMASVPNTYLARFLILDNTPFQGYPYELDSLKSSYLVFVADFHGDLDLYLKGMYQNMKNEIVDIWQHCYGFEKVLQSKDSDGGEAAFLQFIKKCQVKTTFYFDGSNDDALEEQLKSLYLKQELSKFVFSHQGVDASQLLSDFKTFLKDTNPGDLKSPTWKAGSSKQD